MAARKPSKRVKLRHKKCLSCNHLFTTTVMKNVICQSCVAKKNRIKAFLYSEGVSVARTGKALQVMRFKLNADKERTLNSNHEFNDLFVEDAIHVMEGQSLPEFTPTKYVTMKVTNNIKKKFKPEEIVNVKEFEANKLK